MDSIIIVINQIIVAFNSFLESGFFIFVKFLIAVYVIVLFIDLILLLIIRGIGGDLQKTIKGTAMPLTSQKKMKKVWENIEKRLKNDSLSEYKLAILEADKLVDEVLLKIGYEGSNMTERLENANSKQIEELDELIKSHQIRNKIINDKNFVLDGQKAKKIIKPYHDFLEDFEII